jgi:DNA polymerase V
MGGNNLEIMSVKKIAIVDCNNFYVSCERLFNPKLNNKPTVVLSNNDACVIARSKEIKNLGVKMGQPIFNLDDSIKSKMVKFSSNYVLYGDISDRISNILKRFTPSLEIYSIDESFMDLSHVEDHDLLQYMSLIKSEVFRLTGIPVSVGVAPNKTLAKLMNWRAKKDESLEGVCSFFHHPLVNDIEIGEVWGIGDKFENKLQLLGVKTIGQFKELKDYQVRKMLTVVGLRTWMELKGNLIHQLQTKFKKPKVVTSSRSFGRQVWQVEQVKDALATFIEDCCSKLKIEGLKPKVCIIFLTTDRFGENYTVWVKKIRLYNPSNDPQSIWNEISSYFKEIPFKLWAKAGVVCYDLIESNVEIKTLFKEEYKFEKLPNLESKLWMTRRDFLSPKWTTEWSDIPKLS